MDNRTKKMFWLFHNQLINTITKQTFYLIEKNEEDFEVSREEILGTIEKLQLLINPPEDMTPLAINLFTWPILIPWHYPTLGYHIGIIIN